MWERLVVEGCGLDMGSRASKENEKLSCDAVGETRRKSRVLAFLTGTANKRVMKAAGNRVFSRLH